MRDILLITVDSLRADHLGCSGYERDVTPNIDSIAESGYRFTNTFAHAGVTRVSFPTILTSSYPNMYGGYKQLSQERLLISELLDRQGYNTAGFHSNLFLSADFGYSRGFDTFYDSKPEPETTTKLRQFVKQNLDQDGIVYRILEKAYNLAERKGGVEVGSSYVTADEITDRSIEWIEQQADSSPNFLWTHYMDVHHPYLPPEQYQRDIGMSPVSERRAIKLRRKMLESPDKVTESERQTLIDLYDAEIRFTDDEIGRLVETVREHWGDKTVIIITSDHGEEFYEHGDFSHNTLRDEGVHVPLIIHDNDGIGTYSELVGLIDIGPTIAEYTDADIPEKFYGYSLRTLIEGGDWPREHIVGDFGGNQGTPDRFFYRDDQWKYITRPDSTLLFDLEEDPSEQHDIADDVSANRAPIIEQIQRQIEEHRKLVQSTDVSVEEVEMDETVKQRLKQLGYR